MAGEVYTVRVHHEPGEELWAEVLELPGCFAAGADMEELREALSEAISLYLAEPGDVKHVELEDEPPDLQLPALGADPGRHVRPPPHVHDRGHPAEPGQADAEHRPVGDDGHGPVPGDRLRQVRGDLLLRHRPRPDPQPWETVLVLSAVSALWLVVAVYFLGDISAHFNPATTLAFALRRDMDWVMAGTYWVIQFAAAVCGSLLARGFFGPAGHLAATVPKPGLSWQAAGFEAIITFGLVLMILNMVNGPKLNGPFVPPAVGAYIMAWGTMGGPFEGASMNPARSFGPDVAIGDLSTWWVYLIGPVIGAVIAVGVAYVLRGPAKAQEASAAEGTPLDRATT